MFQGSFLCRTRAQASLVAQAALGAGDGAVEHVLVSCTLQAVRVGERVEVDVLEAVKRYRR